MSRNVLLFGWLFFKLCSNDFRNIGSLNNVTPQYLRTGRSSGLVEVFVGWLGSKTYRRTNAAVGRNAFRQLDGEANRLGEYRGRLDRLNVLGPD